MSQTPNLAGWFKDPVTNKFHATDATSGLDTACLSAFNGTGDSQTKTTTSDGHAVKVTSDGCTDVAGNATAGLDSAAFQVDTTAPISSVDPFATLYNNDGTIDVTYSGASDSTSGLKQVALYVIKPNGTHAFVDSKDSSDEAHPVAASGSFTYNVPTDVVDGYVQGTYGFYTVATDFADNAEGTPTSPDARIKEQLEDSIKPTIAVTPDSPNGDHGWNKTGPVTVTVTASDAGSGLTAAPSCTDGSGAFAITGSAGSWTGQVTADGVHLIDCSVSDKAGNSNSASDTVKLDTVAPAIHDDGTSQTPNLAGWFKDPVTNKFHATDATSGLDTACLGAFNGTGDSQTQTTTSDGHAVKVTSDGCTDVAGNHTAGLDSAAFQVDTTAPISSVDPFATLYNNDGTIDVTYSGASDSTSGLKQVALYVIKPGGTHELVGSDVAADAAHPLSGSGSFTYHVPTDHVDGYVQGTYGFYTRVTDFADITEAAPGSTDARIQEQLEDLIMPTIAVSPPT